MKLFLDANILFTAAHNPEGKAALLIELSDRDCWTLYSSHYALEEARRNLQRKFPKGLASLTSLNSKIRFVNHDPGYVFPDGLASKDRPIFQAALTCRASHLITGDLRDFGPYMNRPEVTHGVVIQTVAEFLAAWSAA